MEYVDEFQSSSGYAAGSWSSDVSASLGSLSVTSRSGSSAEVSLASRLVELGQLFYEDYASELKNESVAACLVFCSLPWIDTPMLSASTDGSIVATWEKAGKCLTIKFVDRHQLHFALATPDLNEGGWVRKWGYGYIGFFLNDNRTAAQIVRR